MLLALPGPRFLALPALLACLAAPSAEAGVGLVGQRAAYTLTLLASPDQNVLAATGTMTYELTDACTGWTTSQHLLINLTNRDGQDVKMVSDYATFESKDGTRLSFHTRQLTDQTVTDSLDGTAVLDRSGGHGHADFTAPDKKRVDLPEGTLLPAAHTEAILKAAQSDRRFFSAPLFDGTGEDGVQDTFVVVGRWDGPRMEKWTALSRLSSARAHVAFYDRDQKTEDPTYQIGVRYFENGVADGLEMNFGDFSMRGELTELKIKPAPHC